MPTQKRSQQQKQPKYRQVADYLREGILNGTFQEGRPVPSEDKLAEQFGVTRPTVRQGIAELRASGLVEVMAGRGAFVRSLHGRPSVTRPRGVRRTSDGRYVEADGIRWTDAEPQTATRTDAPLALAEMLRIPPGEPLYTYDALQTADNGRLRQLHRTYVPFSVLVGTKYEEEAPPPAPELYGALAALGHQLSFTEYVRTRMPLPDQANALRLAEGVPLLQILRLVGNGASTPLAVEEVHLPGGDSELSFNL
ncbi:GntR family transcriptional regulator [Streptomyces tubbatahanensis]|uniref:GntR family transcriptional regulator n=1 Tax=Streptomyces tubbatahanensis TaxID=2923272 RepID=A0ABY3XX26_9ACTN|nr:GntR family transcriptional regulator [Streptomyces tubbatahanensis]UNS98977.1 GntR family transcriptional regulator [Streptomyces tubbatahanensis]